MTAQARGGPTGPSRVLQQLRASGLLDEEENRAAGALALTAAGRGGARASVSRPEIREAKFYFVLGRHAEEVRMKIYSSSPPAEIARTAVRAARASMLKRGFSDADLQHLRIEGGEWLDC